MDLCVFADAVLGAIDKSLKNVPYVAIYSQSDSSAEVQCVLKKITIVTVDLIP